MSLKQLKKNELQILAEELGIEDTTGTKAVLEERILGQFEENPELEDDDRFKKYFTVKRRSPPPKNLRSSPRKATESDYDSSEIEEDVEEDESTPLPTASPACLWFCSLNFKEMVPEPFQFDFDEITEQVVNKHESIRDYLSTINSVTLISSIVEFIALFFNAAPRCDVFLGPSCPLRPQNFGLVFKFIHNELLFWFVLTLLIPLVVSYYFNFLKLSRCDPLVFNLTKALVWYLVVLSGWKFSNFADDIVASALSRSQTCVYSCEAFRRWAFHNAIQARPALGSIPLLGGAVGVLIALYVAILA